MDHVTPKKSLGQNFLIDRNISAKIVREFAPMPDDLVVEIGPGEGALTEMLVESGCRLVAIELDNRLAVRLRERYGARIDVIEQDVLATDLGAISYRYNVEKIRVIGNIPYYITSPIIFHLIDNRSSVRDAMLMMQREVADRLVAQRRTKDYGILSIAAQTYSRPKLLFNVGPKCFYPPPRVTSAIVHFPFQDMDGIAGIERAHRAIVRASFNQRRKTLRNSLAQLIPDGNDRERILQEAGIGPGQRAEELTPEDFIRLARIYAASSKGGQRAEDA
jgi:16S rRNA (adenine1518-N6/adenine1519-N6)-dimethyltransferase